MIREEVSKIIGMRIPEDSWDGIALALDQGGRPTRVETNKILFTMCKAIEELQAREVKSASKGK